MSRVTRWRRSPSCRSGRRCWCSAPAAPPTGCSRRTRPSCGASSSTPPAPSSSRTARAGRRLSGSRPRPPYRESRRRAPIAAYVAAERADRARWRHSARRLHLRGQDRHPHHEPDAGMLDLGRARPPVPGPVGLRLARTVACTNATVRRGQPDEATGDPTAVALVRAATLLGVPADGALGREPAEPGLMRRLPRPRSQNVIQHVGFELAVAAAVIWPRPLMQAILGVTVHDRSAGVVAAVSGPGAGGRWAVTGPDAAYPGQAVAFGPVPLVDRTVARRAGASHGAAVSRATGRSAICRLRCRWRRTRGRGRGCSACG